MKVIAVNSSPMMDKGNTHQILAPFLKGMREAGAEVELFYTKRLKINPCQGEFNCWTKHPGKCFQDDDMQMLLPKLAQADVWVLATPVYTDGVNGSMKTLMDRTIPLVQGATELRDGHCRHVVRNGHKYGKVVLVSSCGFWEKDNFDPLLVHMRAFCRNGAKEFAGALLRPYGWIMKAPSEFGLPLDEIQKAAEEAGQGLVRDGAMSADALSTVSRELISQEMCVRIMNQSFQRA